MIHLARPEMDDADVAAVTRALRSGWLARGPEARAFEAELCAATGAAAAVVVSSGTAALEIALRAAGVGPGDEVLVPAFTYLATAHAVRLAGADPVLVDVDPGTWNMDPAAAARAVTPRTRAVMPVDQLGVPVDLDPLRRLARPGGGSIALVEDAACALGASRRGAPVGSDAPLACLSFHPRKVITTGEGGAILAADPHLAARARRLRDHGRDDEGRFVEVAGNQRLSEPAAALGRAQLARLDAILARRRALAARYRERLAAIPGLGLQRPPAGFAATEQTFAVLLPEAAPPRASVVAALRARGIESGPATFGVHLEAPYRDDPRWPPESLPVATGLARRALALPLHGGMGGADVDRVAAAMEEVLPR